MQASPSTLDVDVDLTTSEPMAWKVETLPTGELELPPIIFLMWVLKRGDWAWLCFTEHCGVEGSLRVLCDVVFFCDRRLPFLVRDCEII